MGLTRLGFDSLVQFGRESTWGTAVAAAYRLPARSIEMHGDMERHESGVLDGGPVVSKIYDGRKMGTCEVEAEVWYDNFNLIWDCLMGTDAFGANGGSTGGPVGGIYTHTWATQKPVHNSLSLQRKLGGTAGRRLTGAKIEEMVISGSGEGSEPVLARIRFLGKTVGLMDPITAGLTLPTASPVFGFHADNTLMLDGVTLLEADRKVKSFELTIRNGLFDGAVLEASQTRSEPERVARAEVLYTVTSRFVTTEAITIWLGTGGGGTPTLRFASGTKSLKFVIEQATLMNYADPIPTPDGYDFTATWKSTLYLGTGITIEAKNTQASIH